MQWTVRFIFSLYKKVEGSKKISVLQILRRNTTGTSYSTCMYSFLLYAMGLVILCAPLDHKLYSSCLYLTFLWILDFHQNFNISKKNQFYQQFYSLALQITPGCWSMIIGYSFKATQDSLRGKLERKYLL